MKRTLLTLLFVLSALGLADWLFANWYVWSMADFDCDAGYWACRRPIIVSTALQCGVPLGAWIALGVLMAREWKKP